MGVRRVVCSGGHAERLGTDAAESGQLIESIWCGWHGAPSGVDTSAALPLSTAPPHSAALSHSAASQGSSCGSTPRQAPRSLISGTQPAISGMSSALSLRLQPSTADAVSVADTPQSAPAVSVDNDGAGGPLVGDSWHWDVLLPHVAAASAGAKRSSALSTARTQ